MTVACIVQARLGSSRLPAKVLLPLPTGRTVLEEVLHRCKQIPGVDVVVCAIPDTAENDILASVLDEMFRDESWSYGIEQAVVRGPEHDVLARYVKAAEAVKADVIMRITADCPLVDPEVCGQVLALAKEREAGYASNVWPDRTFPQGFDCEVFTRHVLHLAHKEIPPFYENVPMAGGGLEGREGLGAMYREHAGCTWMQGQEFGNVCLRSERNRSSEQLTLDTIHDYRRIWSVFEQQMREAA